MRKKKLIEQNLSLFEELQRVRRDLVELRNEYNKNINIINSLKTQLVQINETKDVDKVESSKPAAATPLKRLEEKMLTNASLKPDMEYGANVIGKLVVSAAEYSNKLTIGGDNSKRELLNLILGKTEIAKAEILAVVEGEDSFEAKCAKIDQIAIVTNEYYDSVLAQIV